MLQCVIILLTNRRMEDIFIEFVFDLIESRCLQIESLFSPLAVRNVCHLSDRPVSLSSAARVLVAGLERALEWWRGRTISLSAPHH